MEANDKAAADAKGATANKKIRKAPKALGSVILIVVALAALGYGAVWWANSVAYVETDDAAIDGRQVKLSSKMLGRIAEIKAEEGDKVKSGQVLAVLDDKDLRAQEAQAIASLNYAKENLALAKVNLDKSEEDYGRTNKLYAAGAATKEANDHAQRALDAAQAQYTLADASVETSSAQLGVIEAQILNVKISTPIDGTVEKVSLNAGDLAQPGQTIVSVNNLDSIWVIANFEETKIGRIHAGAPVKVTVDAYGGEVFQARVDMIRAGIVPSAFQIGEFTKTTQRVPVKISFQALPEGVTLLPGMSVEVKVRTSAVLPDFAQRLLR
jgi:membrane fusion protein, multidrug efflux system